jgi:putative ATP-dependent endonuclease of OLD family
MKIKSVILENFRAYGTRTQIEFKDFNVIVGKNDIGKSTVLEAIDIFINDKKAVSPYEKADLNVNGGNDCKITLVFSDLPEELVVDTAATTTLASEYLLREDGYLEIQKTFGASGVKQIDVKANHPSIENGDNLLELKIGELRARADELNIPEADFNGTRSSSIRGAIWNSFGAELNLQAKFITIFKTSDKTQSPAKEIWTQIFNYFPVYSLFQSDRKNEEKDSEVQNPMNAVISRILKEQGLQESLNEIKVQVEAASNEVALRTLDKLKEMNPEIANSLTPRFSDPKWDSVFKFNLFSDNDIPLNKRGSGVRRLILLNFFRAEAERVRDSRNVPHVIYALEEPETSQHPNHQKMLIEAFKELALQPNNQIILTTHSPGIAKQIAPEQIIFLDKEDGNISIPDSNDDILRRIANELGVLPSIELEDVNNVKLAICLEGKNDINFLTGISRNIPELRDIVNLEEDESIIFLPMGGSTLQFWVNSDYLAKLNLNQVHIYDSDLGSDKPNKYSSYAAIINAKGEGNIAFETNLREMENIYPPSLITQIYDVEIPAEINWITTDVPELVARHNHAISDSPHAWEDLDKENIKRKTSNIKNQLNNTHIDLVEMNHLVESNTRDEVIGWFNTINELK